MVLGTNQLMEHDFLCSGLDVIHLLNPSKLVAGFKLLVDTLYLFHLGDDCLQLFPHLFVQINEICPKGTI